MAEEIYPKKDGQYYYAKDTNMNYYQGALGSNMTNKSITVGIIPTLLSKADTKRKTILIQNTSVTITLYIVHITLTSSTGFELGINESVLLHNKEDVYGITSASTTDVRFLEIKRT